MADVLLAAMLEDDIIVTATETTQIVVPLGDITAYILYM